MLLIKCDKCEKIAKLEAINFSFGQLDNLYIQGELWSFMGDGHNCQNCVELQEKKEEVG